jgi:stearoyl-CoA desaturase (Delta-9 desaturase)
MPISDLQTNRTIPVEFASTLKSRIVYSLTSIPFILVHLSCLLVFWAGFSWFALGMCVLMYGIRMFGITAGFHRYFAHRSYETGRFFQLVLALLGTAAAQKGPLWWAAHHRRHHRYSDREEDVHSPIVKNFWWAHVGWVLSPQFDETDYKAIRDFSDYPELLFLNRYHVMAPIALAAALFYFGVGMRVLFPSLQTSGFQVLVWGFFVSTVFLYHGTFFINSLCHIVGTRRFDTGDSSRNNFWLALITLGEGWHNNHHRYPGSERQGFYWWEIDISHYGLTVLSFLGLVWNLRIPPEEIYEEAVRN